MPKLLLLVIGFALSGAVKKMLVGAGLGLVSMIFISSIFQRYLNQALHYSTFDNNADVLYALISLSQADYCISIIISAVVARVAINAMTLTLSKST